MRERGHAIPVAEWWLRLARSLLSNDTRDYQSLGRDLAKHVKRQKPFDKALLSRFVGGTGAATLELVNALCTEFTRLPRPLFFARSYEEAAAMHGVADRYAHAAASNVEAPVVQLPKSDDGRRRKRSTTGAPIAMPVTSRRRTRGA